MFLIRENCLDHIKLRVAFFPHLTQEFHRKKDLGVDRHNLPIPVVARYIRFYPTKHIRWDCLRVEVYGISKGELILSKYNKWILKCYTAVSSVKVNAKTTKGVVGRSQVTVIWLQDFREIYEKFTVRITHSGFMNLFVYFTYWNSLITGYSDYLSRVSRALLFFFATNFLETAVCIHRKTPGKLLTFALHWCNSL